MGCISNQLYGIIADCEANIGGIKKLWITTDYPKPIYDEDTNMIMYFENHGGITWYEYNFAKNTSSFTSTLNKDESAGTKYVSTELSLQFNQMDSTKRQEMEALSVNNMYAVVKDNNNKLWYMGYDLPVTATTGTGTTGTAVSDSNNYQITLTDESKEYLYEISADYDFTAKNIIFTPQICVTDGSGLVPIENGKELDPNDIYEYVPEEGVIYGYFSERKIKELYPKSFYIDSDIIDNAKTYSYAEVSSGNFEFTPIGGSLLYAYKRQIFVDGAAGVYRLRYGNERITDEYQFGFVKYKGPSEEDNDRILFSHYLDNNQAFAINWNIAVDNMYIDIFNSIKDYDEYTYAIYKLPYANAYLVNRFAMFCDLDILNGVDTVSTDWVFSGIDNITPLEFDKVDLPKIEPIMGDFITNATPMLPSNASSIKLATTDDILKDETLGKVIGGIKVNGTWYSMTIEYAGSQVDIRTENPDVTLSGLHTSGKEITISNPSRYNIQAVCILNN